MPGVVVLKPSATSNFSSAYQIVDGILRADRRTASAMQNGSTPHRDIIAEIKEAAKDTVLRASRGVSATSLLASARNQIRQAQASEAEGDLKSAFGGYTKAASLVSMFLETGEFKLESQGAKKGSLYRDFSEFQQVRST